MKNPYGQTVGWEALEMRRHFSVGLPTISVLNTTVSELSGNAAVIVRLNRVAVSDVEVLYQVVPVTTGSEDHFVGTGSIIIPKGTRSGTIPVSIVNDITYEKNETFRVILSPNNGVRLGRVAASIVLRSDDAKPVVSVSMGNGSFVESVGSIALNISLDRPSAFPVLVTIIPDQKRPRVGFAAPGSDFTFDSSTAAIVPGQTSFGYTMRIVDDSIFEGDEVIRMSVKSDRNSVLLSRKVMGIIIDNDVALPVEFAPTSISGRVIRGSIASGNGVFASSGSFEISTSSSTYSLRGLSPGVGDSFGLFSYQRTGPNTAEIRLQDSELGSVLSYVLTYTSPNNASYFVASDFGGTSRGTLRFR